MRGHIIKRYKDSYTIVLHIGKNPISGKPKYQWISVKGTKKEAEKRLSELLHQLDKGEFIKPDKVTVAEFLERWLKDYTRPNLAPKTADWYAYIIRSHIVPTLGNIPLAQLKPETLQRYYAEKLASGRCDGKGALSPQTVRHCHVAIHYAMETAVKWGIITRNPADAVSPPRSQRHQIQTWNEEELGIFLVAAKETPHYALFHLLFASGMRRSEVLALRWCDIDLTLCQIYVTRSLQHLADGTFTFKQPKTARGRRAIALPPSTALILKKHHEKQAFDTAFVGRILKDDDLVFSHLDGKPFLPNSITHAWVKLVRRTGLKYIRLHDARHTHASLMLKQGVHPKIVQERLGHASIQITLDTYSHVAPGLQEAAAARFDEVFKNTSSNERVKKIY
jgi:integrase